MRIAVVAPLVTPIAEPQLGGSQALVADLAAGLSGRGHEVDVYAAAGSRIPGVGVVEVRTGELSASIYRPDRGLPRPDEASLSAFASCYELLSGGEYDLVHVHAFDVAAVDRTAELEVPVVFTLHLPPEPAVAEALRRAPRVVVAAVSRSQADAWRRLVRVDAVLRNGLPLQAIAWSPEPQKGLLFAGRLSPEKGAAEAVEIARRAGLPLRVLGAPYDTGYAAELARSGVEMDGPVPRADLWEAMAESMAVLCPVRWEEPFGLVAAEAQACGTPVVGFRRGALPEVIQDGVTGFLVEGGDIDAAARAVRDARTLDRTECRRHAEATLGLDAMLDAHETLYAGVAGRG
ncbi:MAG TPA: glycosyltransferase [Actinomycetota bacterium]|nr:glycosyltransferase [Actinomycetota bacterium]